MAVPVEAGMIGLCAETTFAFPACMIGLHDAAAPAFAVVEATIWGTCAVVAGRSGR